MKAIRAKETQEPQVVQVDPSLLTCDVVIRIRNSKIGKPLVFDFGPPVDWRELKMALMKTAEFVENDFFDRAKQAGVLFYPSSSAGHQQEPSRELEVVDGDTPKSE